MKKMKFQKNSLKKPKKRRGLKIGCSCLSGCLFLVLGLILVAAVFLFFVYRDISLVFESIMVILKLIERLISSLI